MYRIPCRWLLPVAAAVAMSAAHAQSTPRPAVPSNPLDAGASVPPLAYRSALGSYRRIGDDKPVPWREANETVGRIGGWRAYAREAAEAAEPAAAVASPPSSAASAAARPAPMRMRMPMPMPMPMPAGHGGHEKH